MTIPRPIRWLHLSDLHMGCKGHAVWEQVETSFLQDLDAHLDNHEPPDLLLFTGDLAYSGQAEEYKAVDDLLDTIVERIQRSGCPAPILLPVPGNHDVMRPTSRADRLAFRILKDFDGTIDDPEVAEIYKELWKDENASFLSPLFKDYIAWFDQRVRPHLETRCHAVHFSHFPCDYLAEIYPDGAFPIAILGLNSSWMQYTRGDFNGKLLMPIEQYRAAVAPADKGPEEVLERNDHTLLLMHQPPSWLCPAGRRIFDAHIYRPGVITACLFGHMHEANGTEFRGAGGKPRVFLQSPSLFGLEKYGTSEEDRALGYSWGQLTQDGEIRIWPRELRPKRNGVWSFGADPGLHYEADGSVLMRRGHHTPQDVAVAQRGIDRKAYLDYVIEQTCTLEIRGIVRDRVHSAIRPPIESLYTPLRRRAVGQIEHGRSSSGNRSTSVLHSVLAESRFTLIEGEPGAGKTTFLRLVACMLARDLANQHCPGGKSWCQVHLGMSKDNALVPIFLRLSSMAPLLESSSNTTDDGRDFIIQMLQRELETSGHQDDFDKDYWSRLLHSGEAWLLLDGLDEVDDLEMRERLFNVVRDVVKNWRSPVTVTSRPLNQEAMARLGFRITAIEPFSSQQIRTFLAYWVAALYRQDPKTALRGETLRYKERLEETIFSRPKVRTLASNPVMLTCLCVVHWNQGDLPDVRSRVYEAVIRWLLHARSTKRLDKFGLETDFAERTLSTLALYGLQNGQGKKSLLRLDDAAEIVAQDLERWFPESTIAEKYRLARRWLLFECEGSGVIEETVGARIRFVHLTFQEFLAALKLARMERTDWLPIISQNLKNTAWRETRELFVTCLYDLGLPESIDGLLQGILIPDSRRDNNSLEQQAIAVGILGRLLRPLEHCGYFLKPEMKDIYQEALGNSMELFNPEGSKKVPLGTRIAAAEALGQGGDPRLRPELFDENLLGTNSSNWRMGKYLVTVEEFQSFVEAKGYEDSRWWGDEGWRIRAKNGWEEPGHWLDQLKAPNRPIVEVSWWEATAYCQWISDLRRLNIRLPAESEWELAAVCPESTYPWGNSKPSSQLANFRPTDRTQEWAGHATPVGIFPRGDGAFGHSDLVGNVWEMCSDISLNDNTCTVRGGSWWVWPALISSQTKGRLDREYRGIFSGFRVVCIHEPCHQGKPTD